MREDVKLEGFRELEDALTDLGKATAKNTMRRALVEAGEPVATDYKGRVAVATGRLRDGSGVSTKLSKRQAAINRSAEGKSTVEAYIGAPAVPEAHLEEFGTQFNPPRGDLRAAWDAHWREVLDNIKAALWRQIEAARARAARKAARIIAKTGG